MNKTAVKVFENKELGKVRTIVVDGEPWWVLKDVCGILEIVNHKDLPKRLDEDEVGRFELPHPQSNDKTIRMTCVNESGLYSVILRSDKPQAKPFRKWVTHEILPSIRKTGGYIARGSEASFMRNPDSPLYPYIETLNKSIEILQMQITELQNSRRQPNYWLWKNHVATPAVSNLAKKLNVDMRTAYDIIYDRMFVIYGFDRSFAINQFCAKYCMDTASVIDCVADSPIYQQNFITVVAGLIDDSADKEIASDNSLNSTALFTADDDFDYVIKTLSDNLNQTITRTTRQIYAEMNTWSGWKNIMTRRHFTTKRAVIESCKDYKQKFVKTCNRMAGESK